MISSIVKTAVCEVILLLICLLGDHLLSHPIAKQQLIRAFTDSLTHGLVGGISWAVVTDVQLDRQRIAEGILCLALAMSVDLDHFMAAKSFHLKDALSLQKRPFFHATTLIIIIDGILIVMSLLLRTRSLQLFTMIFSVAWLSHHVRDSVRRGLWFPPFGETPQLPKFLYLICISLIPLVTKFVYYRWKTHAGHRTLQYYDTDHV